MFLTLCYFTACQPSATQEENTVANEQSTSSLPKPTTAEEKVIAKILHDVHDPGFDFGNFQDWTIALNPRDKTPALTNTRILDEFGKIIERQDTVIVNGDWFITNGFLFHKNYQHITFEFQNSHFHWDRCQSIDCVPFDTGELTDKSSKSVGYYNKPKGYPIVYDQYGNWYEAVTEWEYVTHIPCVVLEGNDYVEKNLATYISGNVIVVASELFIYDEDKFNVADIKHFRLEHRDVIPSNPYLLHAVTGDTLNNISVWNGETVLYGDDEIYISQPQHGYTMYDATYRVFSLEERYAYSVSIPHSQNVMNEPKLIHRGDSTIVQFTNNDGYVEFKPKSWSMPSTRK